MSASLSAGADAELAIGSSELALIGALLALSAIALVPLALFLVGRMHPVREAGGASWGFAQVAQVVLAYLLAGALMQAVWPLPADASLDQMLVRGALTFGAAGALALFHARRSAPEGARALGLRSGRNVSAVSAGVASYLLLAPALLGVALTWPWLLEQLGGAWRPQAVLEGFLHLEGARLSLAIALAVVVVPFLEELLFRGYLQPLLVQRCGARGGVVLTSLVFAALHGLGAFLPIFAFSLLLGGLMWRTQRLSACWAVHALHNGLSIALLLASEGVREVLQGPPPALAIFG